MFSDLIRQDEKAGPTRRKFTASLCFWTKVNFSACECLTFHFWLSVSCETVSLMHRSACFYITHLCCNVSCHVIVNDAEVRVEPEQTFTGMLEDKCATTLLISTLLYLDMYTNQLSALCLTALFLITAYLPRRVPQDGDTLSKGLRDSSCTILKE